MATKFKLGDIVQLKSGGPAMTVSSFTKNSSTGQVTGYYCDWFKGASNERASFAEDTLQAYVAPKKA